MSQREDALKFETGRIKALQEERLHIQKKTFTKWMNSFLQKARMEVEDLFMDLADGRKLLKLLEIISGEKLGKPNNGKMRVHKIENVNKSLAFLHTKVRLESIGAEDIVDGNPRLILGLIWTIILRFQIQEIEIDVDEDNESSEKKSAKDALLLWCQRKTNGYAGVNIQDFTGSWRSGLGFNALIHSHRPDLIDYAALQPSRHIDNLNNAFDIAQQELGIPRLLDAEDIDLAKPDEKSIITYVASYYHTFARMKNEMKGGRRIANIVGQMMDADKLKGNYERLTTDLIDWIRQKVTELQDRNFPNSLEGIQKELLKFKQYRTVEKPPKYKERSDVEALFFNINTKLKSLNQPIYLPPDGKLIHDIESAWQKLEKAEHLREVALREELLRQERLEQLAYKFERKSVLREGYLKEMIQVLSDPRYGSNVGQVEATVKKHEAISADILARRERFHDLTNMADELMQENYHGKDRIKNRETEILDKWQQLLDLLEKHKIYLNTSSHLMAMLREADTIMGSISDLEDSFRSSDVGPHLLAVEDLLQKHNLQESEITSMGETIKRLNRQGQQYATAGHKEAPILQKKLEKLNKEYDNSLKLCKDRWARLEDSRNFYQFLQDHEEEESWVIEKQRICRTGIVAKDLRAVLSLQQKHKAMMDEIQARSPKSDKVMEVGRELVAAKHPESDTIKVCIDSLEKKWKELMELVGVRQKQLQDAGEAYQFYADANEADSWIKEKMPLVSSKDYGEDEPSAQALLQRHRDLEGEIKAYVGDIQGLNSQADALIRSGINSLELQEQPAATEPEPREEVVQEVRMVPQEVWEDEPYERIEHRTVVEERVVPQVKAQYAFNGQGMTVAKGEVMFLLNKTNNDWWNVRKANGQDGFVPANYVKEIDPKVVPVQVKKSEKIKEMRPVKKIKMVRQVVPVKKTKSPRAPPRGVKRAADENETVEKRQKKINTDYEQLVKLAEQRHAYLEDAIRLFGFYRECDDFEKWIKDKEKVLKSDDKAESVETAKRKFEKFLTDLYASSKRIDIIDEMAKDFERTGHSQLDKVKARQRHIHKLWDNLNALKAQKERSLEGASSVELFNRTCDEARDWMLDKMTKMDVDDLGEDLKTVQALQRKHLNLERELAPVEEKVGRVNMLADSVKASYPLERANVNKRQEDIQSLWGQLKDKAVQRRSRLEEAVGQQIFMNNAKSLLAWVEDVKEALATEKPARDVATAEALLKMHDELGDDIRTHQHEFTDVINLGTKLLKKNPDCKEVRDQLVKLQEGGKSIYRSWQDKGDWLRQCVDLQMFNREADQIDAATSSHETFLEFEDLGNSLDDVEALLKRQEDFENTLSAQDERLKSFSEMADKLIAARHYDSKNINDRRNQVLGRREDVKAKAAERKKMLRAAEQYQEFKADVEDMKSWIAEKHKMAVDESYRDLSNLERKLKKHEAFERELRANEGRLKNINKSGNRLVAANHYNKPHIQEMLKDLNHDWEVLCALAQEKGRKLHQAAAEHKYNKTLDDTRVKLDEFDAALQSDELGTDLRNCKDLLKKHQALESDMSQQKQKIDNLVTLGDEMAQDGHFDADNIVRSSRECKDRFDALKGPVSHRREALEEALCFQKFLFEVEAELQWIREHLVPAKAESVGDNLHQAQTLYKKHKKLEAEIQGHQPMIDKTLTNGQSLVDQKHPKENEVKAKCHELQKSWNKLLEAAQERNKRLELSLKAQQFFFDANEVESWMNEKNTLLSSKDYGKDEDAAIKLLTKHKGLELELDTYSGLVAEMGNMANAMINAKHPEAKVIGNRRQLITQQLKNLQKMATVRRLKLMESMYRHEYFRESDELEQWINEQMQMATSEDYGQDYEHLLMLLNKFADFKHRVSAGSERFNQCEDLCKKLIASESPYAADIEKRQGQLSSGDFAREVSERHEKLRLAWNNLLTHIASRDQKLQAAGEIHRFNRDVADALGRIQEKYSSIPEDLGRDLPSVQNLTRKHEGFENDLMALEAQLQVLVDDAVRLQSLYPGNNAEHIQQQQTVVVDNWTVLQEKAAQRKEDLKASADLHYFLSLVRDLQNWATDVKASMATEEKVRDVGSAQVLKAEHDRLKAEIEAREDSYSNVMQRGEGMIEQKHYAAQEIKNKIQQLLEEREKLHGSWQQKKVYLDQLIDLHFFLRDAKQLDTICSTQEVALGSPDWGVTVEEVDALVKKQEAFEKLMATQEEKFTTLQEHGDKLVQQRHFDSENILKRLDEVARRRQRVKNLCNARRQTLADNLLYAQFVRDVGEAEAWIGEKQKTLETEASKGEVSNLEDKIKKLQKHQAFQAELSAHEGKIQEIKQKGETLLSKHHPNAHEVRLMLEHLLSAWRNLLRESVDRSRGLEEAQDILEFNNQVEKAEAWIRDKEMMVQVGDMGRDYEHCLALQRKLDDVDSDMRVDDSRIKIINALADKLIRQGRSETRAIQQRREDLNQKWKALQGALEEYRDHLGGALEIHALNRDVDDTNGRINEKAMAMSVEDCGKDLAGVETLQRKQEAMERDMTAIDGKLKEHNSEARRLSQKYPDMTNSIRNKLGELQDNWQRLKQICLSRRHQLASAHDLQKFLSDLREMEDWAHGMESRMAASGTASNASEAEAMLNLHQERKAEMDGRQEVFKALKEFGERLAAKGGPGKEEVEKGVKWLEEIRRGLMASWEERRDLLTQGLQLQLFEEQAEQADEWMAGKEAFLNNQDLGESMSSVEALMKKHDSFEKTIQAQSGRINDLEKFARGLVADNHYDSGRIQQRLQGICQRCSKLKESAAVRRRKLYESLQLQQFLRNIYEVEGWVVEKLQVASDEAYQDSTNLQSKIQKHQAFEAELTAHEASIDSVHREGEQLIGAGHFASMEISARLDELRALCKQLQEASQLKRRRLQEAYQALLFFRTVEDLDAWIDEVEVQLQSEDHGRDLTSVQNLLKKHQQVEADINSHLETTEQVKETAGSFQKDNHFMKEEIQTKANTVIRRYQALHEPMQIRHDNLEDALLLQQFLRDVEDEAQWITEKEPLASSTDLGLSLTAVQSLQKKHQALEAEIQTHEPLIGTLGRRSQQMIRSNHFASVQIETQMKSLQEQLNHLKDQASLRRLRLLDAVESQMFYAEASEAEAWIKEKCPLLTSSDYGKDEGSVQSLEKKLNNLQRDISNFNNNIGKLSKLSQNLIDRGHFDSDNIRGKQAEIEEKYQELQHLAESRQKKLEDNKKLFRFLREADEVSEWVHEQMAVAASEDYGRDVEHVEVLIQKFDSFLNILNANEDRVLSVRNTAKTMLQERHPENERIYSKVEDLQQLWEDLRELAHARQEALAGAKQVHVFDRDADETIGWIQEKDATLSSEDYGHDLESIQALQRKHEGFERDLAAVKEQVESVMIEAGRLAELFPDAREHISVKHEETVEAWNDLLDKTALRKDKLLQAEQLQAYFDEYRELMAWVNEMVAKITAPELARDVSGAEALLFRHQEYKTEIDTRAEALDNFDQAGKQLIEQGHFLAIEIEERVTTLAQRRQLLLDTWQKRKLLYDQNLDTQNFKRDAEQLENWLQSREPILQDPQLGESIVQVEELIRKHEDFEKTIEAQEEKLEAIRRITMVEQFFNAQKKSEEEARKAEVERVEKERLQALKRKEVQRITDERRREDERRRTQEIKFSREDAERMAMNMNGDVGSSNSINIEKMNQGQGEDSSRLGMQQGVHPEVPEAAHLGLRRMSSQSSLTGEKLRRGEEKSQAELPSFLQMSSTHDYFSSGEGDAGRFGGDIKRAESMKVEMKKPKRTPSFTTRRRTQSFRKLKRLENQNLPPVEIEAYLERKHELQSGGKKAAVRSWKTFYTVLCGQLLCFFKDQEDFFSSKAAASPILIYLSVCEKAEDYTKRKHVFRIRPTEGSEYLFACESEKQMEDWVNKVNFHAQLSPSMQLLSYDMHKGQVSEKIGGGAELLAKAEEQKPLLPQAHPYQHHHHQRQGSSSNSDRSTPESNRKAWEAPAPLKSQEPLYANFEVMQMQQQQQQQEDFRQEKPPLPTVPPRSINNRPPEEGSLVQSRIQIFQEGKPNDGLPDVTYQRTAAPRSHPPQPQPWDGQNGPPQNQQEVWIRRESPGSPHEIPPLPSSAPPMGAPRYQQQHVRSLSMDEDMPEEGLSHPPVYSNVPPLRQSYPGGDPVPANRVPMVSRTGSLPPSTSPPARPYVELRQQRKSDSSSESDASAAPKERERKSGGIIGLFRKKRATPL